MTWGLIILVSVAVPVAVMAAFGRGLRSQGLWLPNRLGWRIVLVGYLVALPWVASMALDPAFEAYYWPRVHPHFWEAILTYGFVLLPEHISFHGWALAALLPARKFARVELAPLAGPWWRRALMWVGLLQPAKGTVLQRGLCWIGLDGGALLAVVLSGTHFFIAHIGKPPAELVASFFGGMGLAYLAYRSRSMWPPLILHVMTGMTALLILWLKKGMPLS